MGEAPKTEVTIDTPPADVTPPPASTMATDMNQMFAIKPGEQTADATKVTDGSNPQKELEDKIASLEEMITAKNEANNNNNKILEAINNAVTPKDNVKTPIQILSDQMYTDPDAYTRGVIEQAKAELRVEGDQKDSNKSWWDGFYERNPDLANQKSMVDMISRADTETLKSMTVEAAEKTIAEKARGMISGIASQAGVKIEDVNTGNTTLLDSNNTGNPPPAKTAKVETFFDQIKDFQKK